MVQANIFYSGMVQGVGFRYTTQRIALDLNLSGWVRNLSDGRVEVLVEGPKDKIEQLMAALQEHFLQYIKNQQVNYYSATGKSYSFSVAPTL
ncbi:MAG: acylphosphatase [Candidatus Omnitrophica bacterium]|nr:acylphosphatase [Candidatus Omnitrophota bacterium]